MMRGSVFCKPKKKTSMEGLPPPALGSRGYYCNVPHVKICGIAPDGQHVLLWDFSCGDEGVQASCVAPEWMRALQEWGVGAWVTLLNVRVRPLPGGGSEIQITPRSRVLLDLDPLQPTTPPPPTPPSRPPPLFHLDPRRPKRKPVWRCDDCSKYNHEHGSACWRCKRMKPKRK
jgi:hypothetical protein